MKTFNEETKAIYVARVKAHADADEIIHGKYWEKGKGCAVGCTVHSSDHSAYERELGIPRIIARLEDQIFEGMSNGKSKKFPLQFIKAVPCGKDLDHVWRKFLIWLLVDKKEGVIQYANKIKTKKVIQDVADLIERSLTEKITSAQFMELRKAYAAADAADAADAAYAADADAAAYAANADAAAYAANAAYAATYAAAATYADAADAATYAADAAAAYAAAATYAADAAAAYAAAATYAADAADAAYAATYAAAAATYAAAAADAADAAAATYADAADAAVRIKKFEAMADKLIELLKAA